MSDAISTFFEAWSQPDPDRRLALIRQAALDDATYGDPRTPDPIRGPQAMADYVGAFSQAAPGARAVVTDTQTQHGLTRATIAFRMQDGAEQMGQYIIQTDSDGRIVAMTGFVGTGAPA